MPALRTAIITLAVGLVVGCGSRPDRDEQLSHLKSLHVMPSISGNLTDTSFRLEGALREAVSRSLAAHGYSAGAEGVADGYVRVAWILGRDISPSGQDERTLSLSLSIFSRSGDRVFSARSPECWPERMWSEDRMTTEIARMLRTLPEARGSAMAPAEGKPALAPIRLK